MVKNLKSLRIDAGYSQKQLADVINVSQQSINKYENHDVEPNIETLIAIAKLFDTSVDYLIGLTDIKRKIENVYKFDLNDSEKNVVDMFRQLNDGDRKLIIELLHSLQQKNNR